MEKVDKIEFRDFFEKEDLIRYLFDCINIENSSKSNTGIKSMTYYTENGKPDTSYISFCESAFGELIVEINTSNSNLVRDAFNYIKDVSKKYQKVSIGALSEELFETDLFKKNFKVIKKYDDSYGVFAQYSKDNLPEISLPKNVSVGLASFSEKNAMKFYRDEEWDDLSSIIKYSLKYKKNNMLFVVKENTTICGYLLADCDFKNIYNIGYVFVHENYRGRGYGKLLTLAFSEECYQKGYIPYYGLPSTDYSEIVAIKSGFEELYRHYYVDVKKKFLF